MNISLTPELENAVRRKVESGLYSNPSEVIREALRLSLELDSEHQWLKREAAIGFAQLEAGELTQFASKEEIFGLARGGN